MKLNPSWNPFRRLSWVTIVLALMPNYGYSQSSPQTLRCDPPTARATSVQGIIEFKPAGALPWHTVRRNDTFCPGDVIRVQADSRADISILNQSVLRLNANSSITIEPPKARGTGVIDLIRGAVHFFSRGPNSLEVKTPFTVAGVRGTEFLVSVESQQTLLSVFEGTVVAENTSGSLTLNSGQSGRAQPGKAPTLRQVLRPRDAVHWALYYPPVVYFGKDDLSDTDLDGLPADTADPRVHVYRAHRLLAVGSIDAARTAIARALALAPNDPNAVSLRSIMALVQGEKKLAGEIARDAVQRTPDSATAHLALSYSEQADFDLPGARRSVQRAVELAPDNALAWARLAELHSSFGETSKAIAAAERAARLQPGLSRTQTVLGFARLNAINTKLARERFEKAISLDQADPLPRLGLGLAMIRDGDLNAGSRELEVAASLDSGNAIIRSYLGKAYYEEKRSPRDAREFEVAKQLDPSDPTPWYYDAIQKQTTNQTIAALHDLNKARDLNDNRAVYRSRLLLDSDAASRAAGQARIFSELGFEERALAEGWQAVNRDPSNASAHRFLADSYAALPRHQIARVSELLQSQLLQPLSATPVQPRLAESNLGLISASGPSGLSFNEFNPLFSRDGYSAMVNGVLGSNNAKGIEGVFAGIRGRHAFSVGYTDFNTDGWRVNAGQDDQIGNAFFQMEISPATMLQAELRHRDRMLGDSALRFFSEDALPNFNESEERTTFRLGGRHGLAPNSIFLASLIHQRAKVFLRDMPDDSFIQFDQEFPKIRSTSAELQHIYRANRYSLIAGVGHVSTDARQTLNLGFAPPADIFNESTQSEEGNQSSNGYVYANVSALRNLILTMGLSYEKYQPDNTQNNRNRNQVSPKFGLTWTPVTGTTVRAAAFRALTRSLIADQTLEPTQVAGFNQFYDDAGATDSRRYGLAVDQKFSKSLYGGIEFSRRDLSIPFQDIQFDAFGNIVSDMVLRGDAKENAARAYLFWTPSRQIAVSAQYQYERFANTDPVAFSFSNIKTHRLPLSIKYLHPTGFGASLRGTYVRQRGEYRRAATGLFEPGRDDFFLVDAALTYRLPKRLGLISAGVTNLTNQRFSYQETDLSNAWIQPKRSGFVRVSITF